MNDWLWNILTALCIVFGVWLCRTSTSEPRLTIMGLIAILGGFYILIESNFLEKR